MKKLSTLLGAGVIAAAIAVTPAHALTFNLLDNGGAGAGTEARRGFEIAASYWSSVFTDNVTVNLAIGYANLGTGVIAQAGSNRALLSMNQAYGLLGADAKTAVDARAVANLPTLGLSSINTASGAPGAINTATTNGFLNGTNANNGYTDLTTRIDSDGGVNNSTLAITRASAKALNVTTDVNNAAFNPNVPFNPALPIDALLTFNNTLGFDFDPRNGIASTQFDFIGVAIHEIGHALGFTSGVDSYDSRTAPGQTATGSLTSTEGFVTMNTLDLFRYSDPNRLDWSTQNVHYFSLDKGATQVFGSSLMSTGVRNGDGRQASHFKDSPAGQPQIGILDPTSARGQMQEVTALDVLAFDAIGWDLNFNALDNAGYRKSSNNIFRNFYGLAEVPEPATWAMMLSGFGLLGGAMRRRKARVAVTYA